MKVALNTLGIGIEAFRCPKALVATTGDGMGGSRDGAAATKSNHLCLAHATHLSSSSNETHLHLSAAKRTRLGSIGWGIFWFSGEGREIFNYTL